MIIVFVWSSAFRYEVNEQRRWQLHQQQQQQQYQQVSRFLSLSWTQQQQQHGSTGFFTSNLPSYFFNSKQQFLHVSSVSPPKQQHPELLLWRIPAWYHSSWPVILSSFFLSYASQIWWLSLHPPRYSLLSFNLPLFIYAELCYWNSFIPMLMYRVFDTSPNSAILWKKFVHFFF